MYRRGAVWITRYLICRCSEKKIGRLTGSKLHHLHDRCRPERAYASGRNLSMYTRDKAGYSEFILLPLKKAVQWARTRSMWPLQFGTACCGFEGFAMGAAHYDIARFGMEYARPTPRQADLMLVLGRVTRKLTPVVRRLYDQMAEPKWVIAVGDCASSGGVFNNYATVQGVDQVVPVDFYVAGCPPRPEAILHAIISLQHRVRYLDTTDLIH